MGNNGFILRSNPEAEATKTRLGNPDSGFNTANSKRVTEKQSTGNRAEGSGRLNPNRHAENEMSELLESQNQRVNSCIRQSSNIRESNTHRTEDCMNRVSNRTAAFPEMEQNQITKVLAYFLLVFCGFLLCCMLSDYLPFLIVGAGFLWGGYYLIKNKGL